MTDPGRATGHADPVPVVDPSALEPTEPVPGLSVRTPFRLAGYRLELLVLDGTSGWHRREAPLHGWVRAGRGRLEYGQGDGDPVALGPGDFLRVPVGVVHRYATETGPLELLVVDGEAGAVAAEPHTGSDAAVRPEVVGPGGLVPAAGTPGLVRETPFPGGDVLVMRVRASGGAAAGWHHHGGNVYFGYAVDGPSETEYGPGGRDVARIEVGECFHVPPGLVHRDTNPTDETHTGIIWLCGGPPWVVNLDGPE